MAGKTESPPSEAGEEGCPPLCPLQPHPKPPPSPAANCWPSPDKDEEARQEKQGRAHLPLTTPKRKGLRHSQGFWEAGEAIHSPKAMERAQRLFLTSNFPGPPRCIHYSNKPQNSKPERPGLRLLLRQLCPPSAGSTHHSRLPSPFQGIRPSAYTKPQRGRWMPGSCDACLYYMGNNWGGGRFGMLSAGLKDNVPWESLHKHHA